jgi:putative membrane protein
MPHHHGGIGLMDFSVTTFLVFAAVVYLLGWWNLRSTRGSLSSWRAISFLCGLFLVWCGAASPLAALHHELLTVHMTQHLLLMTLAPPLIWLGEPLKAFCSGLPRRIVNIAGSTFGLLPMRRLGNWLAQLAVGLFLSTVVLIGWHIPVVFALTMQSEVWHVIALVSFLAIGLLFWWPVIRPWPSIPRSELSLIVYLFFATLPCDVLSGFLVFCDRVIYPEYLYSSHLLGFSALGDQQCAAALMWTSVTIVYLVAGAILTMHFLSPQRTDATATTLRQKLEAA